MLTTGLYAPPGVSGGGGDGEGGGGGGGDGASNAAMRMTAGEMLSSGMPTRYWRCGRFALVSIASTMPATISFGVMISTLTVNDATSPLAVSSLPTPSGVLSFVPLHC